MSTPFTFEGFKELLNTKFIRDNNIDGISPTIDGIRSILTETEWSKEDISKNVWASFLNFLGNEKENLGNLDNNDNGLPITNNLWGSEDKSLFEYINEQIDLDNDLYTDLRGQLARNIGSINHETGETSDSTAKTFWNESVSNLIGYYLRNLSPAGINEGKIIEWGEDCSSNLSQVRKADAGKDFSENYVSPLNNVKGVSYRAVRGIDFISEDAQDSNNLKYTNPADTSNAMRLLMPDYERKVKVEDLNRNFWVISQCVAGISAYLFEDDSPISQTIERIINEIVQLWENLLYLWAVFAISMNDKKVYTDIHCEVVPLSISKNYNFRKYDNFDDYDIYDSDNNLDMNKLENQILENLKYLEYMYPESNLCIIPFMRMGNYEHNYYSEEWYPGVAIFDRNLQEENNGGWTFNWFENSNLTSLFPQEKGIKISTQFQFTPPHGNLTRLIDNIWGITKLKNGVMKAYYPISMVESYEEQENDTYYTACRCSVSNFSAIYDNGVKFESITFNIEDVIGKELIKWAENLTQEEYNEHPDEEPQIIDALNFQKAFYSSVFVFDDEFKQENINNFSWNAGMDFQNLELEHEITLSNITPFGHYMGELISMAKKSKKA